MKRNIVLILLFLFFFQLTFVFVENYFFNKDTREDIQTIGQELESNGMSAEQVRALTSNLSMIRMNISSYVNGVTTTIIMVNAVAMYGLYVAIIKSNRRDSSQ